MAFKFFNIGKANAEIDAADSALNPALAKANILSLTVDGKPVPAAEAPLAAKIAALLAVNPPGEGQQNLNELITSNAALAQQLEKITAEHNAAVATVSGLQREKQALEARATTAEGTVATLTAEKAQLNVQIKAATDEFSRLNKQISGYSTELSRICVAAGCLELTTEDGKPLAKEATAEQKQAAADRISVDDKIKAYQGAVNAAIAKTGVDVSRIPNGAPNPSGAPAKAELKGRARFLAANKKNSISKPVTN